MGFIWSARQNMVETQSYGSTSPMCLTISPLQLSLTKRCSQFMEVFLLLSNQSNKSKGLTGSWRFLTMDLYAISCGQILKMDKLDLSYLQEEQDIFLDLKYLKSSSITTDLSIWPEHINFALKAINCCLMINFRQSGQHRITFIVWEIKHRFWNSMNTVINILMFFLKVQRTLPEELAQWWLQLKSMVSEISLKNILCENILCEFYIFHYFIQ